MTISVASVARAPAAAFMNSTAYSTASRAIGNSA